MLFSSYTFIFFFLASLLIVWWYVAKKFENMLAYLLLFASFLFYIMSIESFSHSFEHLILFIITLLCNYQLARLITFVSKNGSSSQNLLPKYLKCTKNILIIGIFFNFLPLIYLKYGFFLAELLNSILGVNLRVSRHNLPLGISFYTFIQVAWLIEIYQGKIEITKLSKYFLFSSNFLYITSGPIVRFSQISTQFAHLKQFESHTVSVGSVLFVLGLSKKIILADTLANFANPIFIAAAAGSSLTLAEAWLGSLSYTFQLYFDFSGYTDMALGIALLFGIYLPENFNSPYKAASIIDFWRRWHITLSTWFRDFLYIPMGGNRCGKSRHYFNLFFTMLLCGVWHGAGWPFILWGMVHGSMLIINHTFRALCKKYNILQNKNAISKAICILFTFICVNFAWIIFRSESLHTVKVMFSTMLGYTPQGQDHVLLLASSNFNITQVSIIILICSCICWFFPNSYDFVFRRDKTKSIFHWTPSLLWAVFLGLLGCISLLLMQRTTTFLYFAF